MILTVSKLQREFGLPFHVAETILREQSALARQHYRHWYVPAWIGIAVMLACNFAPSDSPFLHASRFILPFECVYLGTLQFFTYHRARPLILAAARAAALTR